MKKGKGSVWMGALVAAGILAGCNSSTDSDDDVAAGKAQEAANLEKFDRLDFDAFSKQADMDLFRKLHCADVLVVFPDGRSTTGIDRHVQDIGMFFNGTPDLRITSHPIKMASGDWTGVTGVMEATFSEPMQIGEGQTIPPNGKSVKLPMATFARWKDGCIAEEHLFLDNGEYMKQLGLGG